MRYVLSTLCIILVAATAAGAADVTDSATVPTLYAFYGLDSVPTQSADTIPFEAPGGYFHMLLPPFWTPMPQADIEGYLSGRPAGHYTDTSHMECASGGGAITRGYLRPTGYSNTALLSDTPESPGLGSPAGLVYVTKYRRAFDYSLGSDSIAEQIQQSQEESASKRTSQFEQYPPSGIADLNGHVCQTSSTQFQDGAIFLTNCTVNIIVPEQETVWTFILLAPAKNYPVCLKHFITMLYSVHFTG